MNVAGAVLTRVKMQMFPRRALSPGLRGRVVSPDARISARPKAPGRELSMRNSRVRYVKENRAFFMRTDRRVILLLKFTRALAVSNFGEDIIANYRQLLPAIARARYAARGPDRRLRRGRQTLATCSRPRVCARKNRASVCTRAYIYVCARSVGTRLAVLYN